jgi:probable F420-dependent oxidoreductase
MKPSTTLELGLGFANVLGDAHPRTTISVAQRAERAGFDSVWTVDHTVIPAFYEPRHPFRSSGRLPGSPDSPIPDPLIWLSSLVGRTERIRLATGVLILPQRSPFIVAKEAATIDVLSDGRAILGVGLGWIREEFDALGADFENRASRMEEEIEVMRILWKENCSSFTGKYYKFPDVRSFPKPIRGSVPIIIGGNSEVAARRAARIGDGFLPAAGSLEDVARLIGIFRGAAQELGREGLEVSVFGQPDRETLKRVRELGVRRLIVTPRGRTIDELRDFVDMAANAVAGQG